MMSPTFSAYASDSHEVLNRFASLAQREPDCISKGSHAFASRSILTRILMLVLASSHFSEVGGFRI